MFNTNFQYKCLIEMFNTNVEAQKWSSLRSRGSMEPSAFDISISSITQTLIDFIDQNPSFSIYFLISFDIFLISFDHYQKFG